MTAHLNVPDIQWCQLDAASLEDPELRTAILTFRALPNPAGVGAQSWLRERVDERNVPFETQLARSSVSGEILGFYALKDYEMNLSKDDSVIVRVRRIWDRNSDAGEQPGSEVCWIARDSSTNAGFGRNLFEHAVVNTQRRGGVALVVTPHDDATATLWRRNYHFMPFKNAPKDDPVRLWHPVDELVGADWPS